MKRLLFAALALISATLAFAQSDPLTAQEITVTRQENGKFTIGAHDYFPDLDSATVAQFLQNRVKSFQGQASQLEKEAQRRKEQAAREAAFFEDQTGISLDSLYASVLESLTGEWTLKIGDVKDNLTIEKDGTFKSKKSGNGKIKALAEDKIQLILGDQEALELYKKKESWRSLDGEKVVLERKVQGVKK